MKPNPLSFTLALTSPTTLKAMRHAVKIMLIMGCLALFSSFETVKGGLANVNSNANATNQYNFISGLSAKTSKRILSGQNILQETNTPTGIMDENDLIWGLENQTGELPAIVGADLNDTNTNAMMPAQLVTLAQTTGCMIELDGGLTFPNQTSGESLTHLLPGGADRAAWLASMDAVAATLQYLQANNVTVLYRPMHEMNGSWTPYYTTDTASFQALWQDLFTYFTQTKGLNNLIWVFGPNDATGTVPSCQPYYPGSAYVDIVGADVYNDAATMHEYNFFTTLGKPIFYTEFGNGSGSGGGTYNGTYNFETQLIATIKNTYPKIVGFLAWSDWSSSGTWIYKSIQHNIDGGMMSDSWVLTAADVESLGSPLAGMTGYYEIANQSTGAALTLNSLTVDAVVSGSTYAGNIYQKWGLSPDVGGGYTITDAYSYDVIFDLSPGTSGESVEQYGEANFLIGYRAWTVTSNGDGTYSIVNVKYPTQCLTSSGTTITTSTNTGAANQKWILTPVSPSTYTGTGGGIQWGAPTNITTDSDVLANGTYFDAALAPAGANGGSPLTVNGVAFNIIANGNVNVVDPSGDITLTSTRNPFTGGNSPSGSAAYNTLVAHTEYAQNATQTVTLNHLTVGHTYQIQVWSAAIAGANYLTNMNAANTVTLSAKTGQYTVGTFTAASNALAFTATNNASSVNGVSMINAISIRDVTATQGQIVWGAPTNITTDSDVLTNGSYFDAALTPPGANGNTPLTINSALGVTFNIIASGNVNVSDPSGDITLSSSRNPYTGGNSPSGSANYNILVGHTEYAQNTSQTVSLNHLTVGHTYQIQVWSAAIGKGNYLTNLNASNGITLSANTGQYAVGTVTAAASSVSFTATNNTSSLNGVSMLNAISVRDISN